MAENLTFNLDVDSSQAVSSINQFFDAFDKGAAKAKSELNSAFNQTLQTEVKVEFKNGKLVAKEVQSLKQESSRLATAYKAVNGELGKTPNQLKRQSAVLKQLIGDTQKFENGTKKVTAEWKALTARIKEVSNAQSRMSGGSSILQGIAGKFALVQTAANLATTAVISLAKGLTDLAGTAARMETLTLQLEGFTGSAEAAEAAFEQFTEIAANTPFNLEQIANAGKIMMAFGMDTEEAITATEQLGVVSAATGGDVNLLARNMGQIVAQGRAYTRDLTQFAIQGIPIWEQLSQVTGESVSELKKLATEGKITGEEVTAALENMTAEGTAFREIADRMQETFAGRFARIEAGVQKLAKAFIDTFNKIDRSLGRVLTAPMKLLADAMFLVAENLDAITIYYASATAATIAFFAVQKWGTIALLIQKVVAAVVALGSAKKIAAIAAAALQAIMGNFGAVAAGIGAAAVTAGALGVALQKDAQDAKGLKGEIDGVTQAVGELSEKEQELASKSGREEQVEQYKELREQADEYKKKLDEEMEVLKEMKDGIKERYDAENELIKENIDLIDDKINKEKDAYDRAKDLADQRYEKEKSDLDEILAKVRERYDLEIGDLQKKGPAEQALYDLQKKQLEEKIKSGQLDQEALLTAEARLERMNRQEQIEALRLEKAKEEAGIQKEIDDVKAKHLKKDEELKKKYDDRISRLEKEKEEQQALFDENESARDKELKQIDDVIKAVGEVNSEVRTGTAAVQEQIGVVSNLASQWNNVATAASRASAAIRSANAANGSANSGGRASGGPVSGGSTYTVNELGKEAFLSASGKLSMINAPSFGDWRAPSSGTVIPAHLTKQLDIPSGGVNLNGMADVATASAASNGSGFNRLAKAIMGAAGGDNISNNVTVQAVNPAQTANNMMVQLTKLKRLRYS